MHGKEYSCNRSKSLRKYLLQFAPSVVKNKLGIEFEIVDISVSKDLRHITIYSMNLMKGDSICYAHVIKLLKKGIASSVKMRFIPSIEIKRYNKNFVIAKQDYNDFY